MQRILIVEDDQDLAAIIVSSLASKYQLHTAVTLGAAFQLLEAHQYDLVITDRLLPDGDSLDLITYLADVSYQTKVLTISQLTNSVEKIHALESGSDEYLTKPFSLAELKLKVEKFLLYEKKLQNLSISTRFCIFFPDSGLVKKGTEEIYLRKKEAQIFHCLLRNKNHLVSRESIINDVWALGDTLPTQTTLDVYIRRIRVLLGKDGDVITTKRGYGYMIVDA